MCVCVCVCVWFVQTAEKVWLSCFMTVESRSDVRMNFTFLDNKRLKTGIVRSSEKAKG